MTREVKAASDLENTARSGQEGPETGPRDGSAAAGDGAAVLHQIGEVAERAGVSLRTVRYYEEQRLLVPKTRTVGGFRLYSDDQIERLELIKQIKPLGFTVEETRSLLEARDASRDPGAGDAERAAAVQSLREFAAVAARRCEELSIALDRASGLARRLRHEARAAAGGSE
jgi:DNA-binding transcriptional MerR regulator